MHHQQRQPSVEEQTRRRHTLTPAQMLTQSQAASTISADRTPAGRQQSVLHMQQTHGNAAVVRMLATRNAAPARVQRCGANCTCDKCSAERKKDDSTSGVSAVEFVMNRSFAESQSDSSQDVSTGSPQYDKVGVQEAIVTKNGVQRHVSMAGHSDTWIQRRMNWRRSACHAACWGLGGGLVALVSLACAAGTVVTIGGAAIPCSALIVGSAVAGGGLAALCSDACDNYIPDNNVTASNDQQVDDNTPAVADASGNPMSDHTVQDVQEGAPQPEEETASVFA